MTSSHPASRSRVIPFASARPDAAPQPKPALALIRGQRTINLAQLAESIRADRELSYLVTEAASQELGYPWLSVEEAVVLLGGERVCALLSAPRSDDRTTGQPRQTLHRNHFNPAANLFLLATFQEEPI